MLRNLHTKIVLLMTVLMLSAGVLFFWVQAQTMRDYGQAVSQSLNRALAENLVQGFLSDGVATPSMPELFMARLDELMAINPNIDVYLLDKTGEILAGSRSSLALENTRVDMAAVHRFLEGGHDFPLLGDDPLSRDVRKAFSVAPIARDFPERGYLYVVLGSHEYDVRAGELGTGWLFRRMALPITAGLLLALLVAACVTVFLTRGLRLLAQTMQNVRQDTILETLPHFDVLEYPTDEIDRLGQAYNRMVRQINGHLHRLQNTDQSRRELIASVSHDLRTPLAALRGYLETLLLREDKLDPGERRTYLDVAVKQSEHLSQLVNELFELAKLETGDRLPNPEVFPPAELLQDVVQKFGLAARQKSIALQLEMLSPQACILGDIALLERVLENLLENAIRHTPPQGSVVVRMQTDAASLILEVQDSGEGIPAADLPYVFDRFYRVDKSRNQHSGGAGLGLAITKRIVELHHGYIQATARAHGGTCFRIELPLAPTQGRADTGLPPLPIQTGELI